MAQHYPSQQDTSSSDKLERVIRDLYDRIYALERKLQEILNKVNKAS